MSSRTRVLIVDDSATARYALRQALRFDPSIDVIGEAARGEEAISLVLRLRPDIVTMDVVLHRESGIDIAAGIMRSAPLPILVVTGRNPRDPKLVYDALEAGALDVVGKLPSDATPTYERQRERLARLLKALARVPVVRRRATLPRESCPAMEVGFLDESSAPRVVLLGASTGGPPVVAELLQRLPKPMGLPVVLVQHLAEGFDDGFATWLGQVTGHSVTLVRRPLAVHSGTVYVAPSGLHLVFADARTLALSDAAARAHQKPSVDVLFESAAAMFGSSVVAVVLTGMGRDGEVGAITLKRSGAVVLAQSPETCAVSGMPESVIASGAVDAVLAPAELAARLSALVGLRD